jgi:hypothetical protein
MLTFVNQTLMPLEKRRMCAKSKLEDEVDPAYNRKHWKGAPE